MVSSLGQQEGSPDLLQDQGRGSVRGTQRQDLHLLSFQALMQLPPHWPCGLDYVGHVLKSTGTLGL